MVIIFYTFKLNLARECRQWLIFFEPFLGEVLFYRDKKGQALRRPSNKYRVNSMSQWAYPGLDSIVI